MNRSPQTVAGLLAILRLGAAYLPLDPGFPAARLEHIVVDAAPDTLLTQPALADHAVAASCRDRDGRRHGRWRGRRRSRAIDGDDVAYVLYTSGSTGKPKGVEVSHRALMNLLMSMSDQPGFTAGDSLLAVTTLSFDIAALEIFLPLMCGGRLVLATRDDAIDPERLAALIAATRPSVMQATPATWRALLEARLVGRSQSQDSVRRRSVVARSRRIQLPSRAPGEPVEHVRADRDDDPGRPSQQGRARGTRPGRDRATDRQHGDLCPRSGRPAGPHWRHRRIVHRRHGRGARLSRPART